MVKIQKICLEDNYILKNNFFNLLLDIAHYFANLFDNQDFIFTKNDFANFASIEKNIYLILIRLLVNLLHVICIL